MSIAVEYKEEQGLYGVVEERVLEAGLVRRKVDDKLLLCHSVNCTERNGEIFCLSGVECDFPVSIECA